MAMPNPTRINLINTRRRINIARKGHSILKRKREVLVIEFLKLLKESKESRNILNEMIRQAYVMVTTASTYVGNYELEEVALYMKEAEPVKMTIKNIMGVRIPVISRAQESTPQTGFMSSSLAVDDLSDTFTKVTDAIIDTAQREQGLKRLVLEIDKTKRRVNALDYKIIPNLKNQSKYIRMRLEEMDRDTFSALKHVKKKLQKTAQAEAQAAAS
ncbi:MAG: V-type ATP synthase subunit D [Candidatus Micrarchaeota archaeon]|nr:V-type ATP synthase subunit D [Candidatus Micrarchaeota archaeon]